jgi:uncharacterized protein (UPF0261 family)
MTSFGKTVLRYLVSLKPELEALAAMNGDRAGGPLCDAKGLVVFYTEIHAHLPGNVHLADLDTHINDAPVAKAVLIRPPVLT